MIVRLSLMMKFSMSVALVFLLAFAPGCAALDEPLDSLGADDDSEDVGTSEEELRTLPSFKKVWKSYPRGSRGDALTADEVKDKIGGNVDADWITNTCVVRVSYALNYAGFAIPEGKAGLATVSGEDGKRYAFRLREMEKYLRRAVGAPKIVSTNRAEFKSKLKGKKGIIMFQVDSWDDATGHLDLWDGSKVAHAEYFAEASKVMLWTLE